MSSPKIADTWNSILANPEAQRTAVEQHIVNVNCLLVDIESGGWLYNISPAAGEGRIWARLRQVADSAAAVGATTLAELLRKVVLIVESADVQQPGVWRDFIREADPTNHLPTIENGIQNEVQAGYDRLRAFTIQNAT